ELEVSPHLFDRQRVRSVLEPHDLCGRKHVDATQVPVRVGGGEAVEMSTAHGGEQQTVRLVLRDVGKTWVDGDLRRGHGVLPSMTADRRAFSRKRLAAS